MIWFNFWYKNEVMQRILYAPNIRCITITAVMMMGINKTKVLEGAVLGSECYYNMKLYLYGQLLLFSKPVCANHWPLSFGASSILWNNCIQQFSAGSIKTDIQKDCFAWQLMYIALFFFISSWIFMLVNLICCLFSIFLVLISFSLDFLSFCSFTCLYFLSCFQGKLLMHCGKFDLASYHIK